MKELSRMAIPSKSLREKVFTKLQEINTKYEPREEMEPRLRERLQMEFEGDIERLSGLIGREVSWG